MNRMGPDTVTVVRPPGLDWRGDPLPGVPVETDVSGCFFQYVSTSERTGAGDTVTADARVYMPAGSDVLATDRVKFAGVEYQVDGEPFRPHTRGGAEHHARVDLRTVAG